MLVTFSTDRKVAAPTTITVTLGTDTDANTADATLTGAGTDVTLGIELVANSGNFVSGTNNFLFNPADVAKRIRFFLVDDNLNEDTEFFTLTVSGGGLTHTATYGIVDNDPITITLSGGRRVPEENTSPTINWAFSATPSREMSLRFEIYSDNDPETVDATISDGDISTGSDWLPATPPLQARGQIGGPLWIIPAGSTNGQIHLRAFTDDNLNESDKAFLAVLRENNDDPRDRDQIVGAFGEVTVRGSPQAYTIVDNDPLTARIIAPSPASVNEGQSAVFTVVLDGGGRSRGEVTVGYTVTGDADYTDATDGQITFQRVIGNGTTRTRNIMAEIELAIPVDSNRDAGSETLTVTLDRISVSRTGGVVTVADAPNNSASVTVNYLDPMQIFTLGDPATTIAEGEAATYTLNRTGPDLATDIVVNWEIVQDDTGSQDSATDFTGATTGSLTFAADDMSQTFRVEVADDDDNELAEMFRLRFGVAAGGAGGVALPAPLEVTIPVDTDDVALITIGRRYDTSAMVGEASSAAFIISIVDNEGANDRVPLGTDMVVPFTVSGLDADEFTIIEGDAPGRISADGTGGLATLLSAGQYASATVIVNLVGDSLNEASETLTLTGAPPGPDGLRATAPLSRIAYTDGGGSASVEVIDDDPITVSIAAPTPATVAEGATVRFVVTLDVASAGVVTVPYTVSSTAAMPADANNGQITIAAGDTTGGIELAIPDNARLNAGDSETLTVILDQATVAAPGSGTVTSSGSADVTVNYVNTPHVFAVSVDESARSEGDTAVFTVSLTGTAPATPVTVDWEIGGNADASDYVLSGADTDGRLSFSALESQTITVAIAADGLNESTETLIFTLTDVSPAGPAGILTASATVDIAPSDPLRITLSGGSDVPLIEEDFGTPAMPNTTAVVVRLDFGATLTRTLRVPVIVHAPRDPDTLDSHQSLFGTDDGENFRAQVRASDRYLIAQRGNPLFEFAAGTNSGTIPIPVIDNNRNEPEQAFAVTIGRGASGANLLRDFRPSDDRSYSITGAHGDFTVGVDSQTWTVAASDPLTASIAAQTQTVAEGTTASFRVTLAGAMPTTGTVVTYRIGGSVDAGVDYAGTGTAMVMIPGHLSEVAEYMGEVNTGVIAISVLSDRMQEGEERMTVTLDSVRTLDGGPIGIGTPNMAEVTIPANSRTAHRISAAGPDEVAEGDSLGYTVTLRTSELEPLSSPITVNWSITTDVVSANPAELSDLSTSGGTVVFPVGTANGSEETIDLGIVVDDTEFERAEEFSVSLTLAVPDPDTELLQSRLDTTITTSDAVQLSAVRSGHRFSESRNAVLFGIFAYVNVGQSGLPTEGGFTVTWEVAGSGANPADMDADISGAGTVTAIGDTRTRQDTETITWSSIAAASNAAADNRMFAEIASAGALRFVDDNLNESDEMMTFSIVSVGGLDAAGEAGAVEIETSQSSMTIVDNDAITIGIDGPDSVMEGQTARLTVTLPKASVGVVTVPYAVSGAVVTDANDGEIMIAAGRTTGEIALMISTDSILNAGDTATLTVTLGAVTVAAPGRGTVAIIGGSGAASLTVNYVDPTLLAVMAEGATDVEEGAATTFTVTLTGTALADGTPLTVAWEIGGVNVNADDYALSGADTDGSLSFTAAGSQTVTVAIATDGLNESTETLTFTLTEASPTGLADILTASASVAIAPSDPLRITMSGGETLNEEFLGVEAMAAGVEVIPPMPGTGAGVVQLDFGATLTRELRIPVRIHQDGDLNTFDPVFIGRAFSLGTGWSPAQRPAYGHPQAGSTLFNFATGTSAGQIPVPAYNDDPPINEREEAFAMVINTVTGAHGVPTVVVDSQTWIIEASDPLTAVIAAPTQTALEGEAAEFTVTLAGAAASVDTVLTYTIGGDVGAGDDYTGRSTGTVMFSADTGRANPVRTLAIPVLSDRMQEGEETMTVTLDSVQSPGREYPISIGTTATATVMIPANSTASRVITAAGPDEVAEGGVSTYTLTLRIPQSESLMTTITVNWSITTDVASANPAELSDFSTSAGTVVFPAGTASGSAETVQSIGLGIVDDEEFERAEEFSVRLTLVNPNSATEVMQSMLDTTITGPNDAVQLGVSVISSLLPGVVEGASQPFRLNAGAYEGGAGLPTEGEFTVTVEVFGSGANPADIRTDITGFGTVVQRGDTEVRRFTDTIAWSTIQNSASLAGGVFSSLGPSFQAAIITGVSALTIVDDDVNETTKTMTFRIDSVGGLDDDPDEMGAVEIFGSAREVSVAIIDNDAITVGIAPAELFIEEGETAELTVTLDKESQGDVSVSYTVTAGGASAPPYSDDTGGDLTFAAGSTSTVVRITSSQTDDIGAGTGTLTVAFDTVATGPRGGAISSAGMAVITVTFLSFDDRPPMLEGLAWAPGQQTLWLTTNEPFKVLAHPDEPMASSDTASFSGMDVLNVGDFMVLENYVMGMARATPLSVTGVNVMPQNQGLALSLERGLAVTAAPLFLRYQHTAGTPAIYDTAFEQGSHDPDMGRNHLESQGPFILRPTGVMDSNGDSDGDGMPDVVEIAIGENPLVAVASTRQPAFSIRSAGTESAPFYIAYSGIRRYGVREHLGVMDTAASVQAYYRSGDFGYSGGVYGCASGAFPANYMAPLSEGGCEPVNWGNIRVGQTYEIAWLARSSDGVWAVNTATESNLPEQWIRRIPELNMASERVFTTGISVTVLAESDDGRSFTTMTSAAGVLGITDLPGVGALSLWTLSTMTLPGSGHDSLGLSTQTQVVLVGSAVPPLLGRAVLTRGSSEVNVLAEGESGYTLSIPVENSAGIGGLSADNSSVSDESGVLSLITGAPGGPGASGSYEVTMTVNAGVAATTNRAVIRVTIAGVRGGETVSSYRYPVVAADAPLAAERTDSDGDGIADDYDHYDAVAHLPVTVDEGAGGKSWHHIRPVLSEHDLRLGESTFERLGGLEESSVDEYVDYAASRTTGVGSLSAVYDFEISGVDYAGVTEAGGVGGAAGVIIPLPVALHDVGAVTLEKYPSGRLFSTAGENGYGFAPLEGGGCPDDTMGTDSPYRDGSGSLDGAKSVGDACMVVYIVDGGANDEDDTVNGVIRDPLGIRIGGAGRRHSGGAFSPAGLAALLLLLALYSRRRRAA